MKQLLRGCLAPGNKRKVEQNVNAKSMDHRYNIFVRTLRFQLKIQCEKVRAKALINLPGNQEDIVRLCR